MTRGNQPKANRNALSLRLAVFTVARVTGMPLTAAELPPELPLWDEQALLRWSSEFRFFLRWP